MNFKSANEIIELTDFQIHAVKKMMLVAEKLIIINL